MIINNVKDLWQFMMFVELWDGIGTNIVTSLSTTFNGTLHQPLTDPMQHVIQISSSQTKSTSKMMNNKAKRLDCDYANFAESIKHDVY